MIENRADVSYWLPFPSASSRQLRYIVTIDWWMDGVNGMSTHLGHVMPNTTMLKSMEKCVNNVILSVDPNLNMIKF